MLFSDVIGHGQLKKMLQNALAENRTVHAYLFHGPAGVGKCSVAKAFAGALLCQEGSVQACGACSICRRFKEGQLPDFSVLRPAGNTIKIEQIRELQKKAQFKPYEAQRKVYLIEQAESMTTEAANCLLKVLEEPPPNTVFLLTAVNSYSLLPTIISRCQLVPLNKVPVDEIEVLLRETLGESAENAALLASLSDGLPGKAVSMVQSGKGLEVRDIMLKLVEEILKADINELLKTAEELEKRKDILADVFEQLLLWYRDCLILLETGSDSLVVNRDKVDLLKNINSSASKGELVRSIEAVLEAKNQIGRNANTRLVLEVMLLKLASTA